MEGSLLLIDSAGAVYLYPLNEEVPSVLLFSWASRGFFPGGLEELCFELPFFSATLHQVCCFVGRSLPFGDRFSLLWRDTFFFFSLSDLVLPRPRIGRIRMQCC